MSSIRILKVDRVPPAVGPYPSPGATIPLSFFDCLWVVLPPVQLLFLYPDTGESLSSVVSSLKSSLSQTLLNFYSLTGKLNYLPSSGDVFVDCNTRDGVTFVQAECDGADAKLLACSAAHDVGTFSRLVPELDVEVLPATVLAVQATGFAGGGLALGLAFHHAVMDGKGVWQFIEAWSGRCGRGWWASEGAGPLIDRVLVGYHDDVGRQFVRELGPALPNTRITALPVHNNPQLVRRTFTITATAIEVIKQHTMDSNASRFVALAAHIWVSIAHARVVKKENLSTFAFAVDCRPRLDPPIDATFTGNCLSPQYARIRWSKLQTDRGLANACVEINRAVRVGIERPLEGREGWAKAFLSLPPIEDRWFVGMSPRFRAYEADFGWGRPRRVEVISMNGDGEVQLFCGRGAGEMQVSIALPSLDMDRFVEAFERGLRVDME